MPSCLETIRGCGYRQLHDIARLYQASPPLYRGSQLWENLYLRHIRWIKEYGIANFKRSVNLAPIFSGK